MIPVIENPRRRRRRRSLTPKQLAAGFGGKSRMSRRTRRRTRRRNPALATLAGNPRRRRRSSYAVTHTVRRRRRRNPGLGDFTRLISWQTAAGVGVGLFAPSMLVNAVGNYVWSGIPRTGMPGAAVRVGAGLVLGWAAGQWIDRRIGAGVVAGAIGFELYQLANEYLLPTLGLSGVGEYITTANANNLGLYVTAPTGMSGYYQQRITDQALAA